MTIIYVITWHARFVFKVHFMSQARCICFRSVCVHHRNVENIVGKWKMNNNNKAFTCVQYAPTQNSRNDAFRGKQYIFHFKCQSIQRYKYSFRLSYCFSFPIFWGSLRAILLSKRCICRQTIILNVSEFPILRENHSTKYFPMECM